MGVKMSELRCGKLLTSLFSRSYNLKNNSFSNLSYQVEGLVKNVIIKLLLEKYHLNNGKELFRNAQSCFLRLEEHHQGKQTADRQATKGSERVEVNLLDECSWFYR